MWQTKKPSGLAKNVTAKSTDETVKSAAECTMDATTRQRSAARLVPAPVQSDSLSWMVRRGNRIGLTTRADGASQVRRDVWYEGTTAYLSRRRWWQL